MLSFWPLIFSHPPSWWLLGAGAGVLALALVRPDWLAPANRLWFQCALVLVTVTNLILLALVFFLIVTPMGLLMRVFRHDPLRLKRDAADDSYWIRRESPGSGPERLKDQF